MEAADLPRPVGVVPDRSDAGHLDGRRGRERRCLPGLLECEAFGCQDEGAWLLGEPVSVLTDSPNVERIPDPVRGGILRPPEPTLSVAWIVRPGAERCVSTLRVACHARDSADRGRRSNAALRGSCGKRSQKPRAALGMLTASLSSSVVNGNDAGCASAPSA